MHVRIGRFTYSITTQNILWQSTTILSMMCLQTATFYTLWTVPVGFILCQVFIILYSAQGQQNQTSQFWQSHPTLTSELSALWSFSGIGWWHCPHWYFTICGYLLFLNDCLAGAFTCWGLENCWLFFCGTGITCLATAFWVTAEDWVFEFLVSSGFVCDSWWSFSCQDFRYYMLSEHLFTSWQKGIIPKTSIKWDGDHFHIKSCPYNKKA